MQLLKITLAVAVALALSTSASALTIQLTAAMRGSWVAIKVAFSGAALH